MSVQRALTVRHEAYLNTLFAQSFVQMKPGLNLDIIEALVGRFTRGKRKGLLRGTVIWNKTEVGGWSRADRGVRYPGVQEDSIEIWKNYHTPSAERVF